MKTAEERIDSLERSLRLYRILVILMAVLIFVIENDRINGWVHAGKAWISSIGRAAV